MFIVRNSWGDGWGDKGYAYLGYDYICNPDFNFLGQYAIKGLTDIDFTPDDTCLNNELPPGLTAVSAPSLRLFAL